MRRTANVTITRVVLVYLIGLLGGAQVALFMFDRLDDGAAESLSLYIGFLIVAVGVAFILWLFRGDAEQRGEP